MCWYGSFHLSEASFFYWKPFSERGRGERLLEGGRLKEGGVHNFFLILGGAFIWGRRLKKPIEILFQRIRAHVTLALTMTLTSDNRTLTWSKIGPAVPVVPLLNKKMLAGSYLPLMVVSGHRRQPFLKKYRLCSLLLIH